MQINNVREEKNRLRKKYRAIRKNIMPEQKKILEKRILGRIISLYQYRDAGTVLTYVSKEEETDTFMLINKALEDGKRVAVPKCVDGTFLMDFYYITDIGQLEKSSFGVMEPKTDICEKMTSGFEDSICIVPGMAFDSRGFRLGYGKGYYDRFLSGYNGVTIGITFSECVLWGLPHGRFDKPVQLLITDRFLRKIRTGENSSDNNLSTKQRRSFSDE